MPASRLEVDVQQGCKGKVILDDLELPGCTGVDVQLRVNEPNRVAIYVLVDRVMVTADAPEGWRLEDA